MAIKSKDEIMNTINEIVGENTEDNMLSLLEDIEDTFSDFEQKTKDSTNWKEKYEENDKNWRQKYKDRFFNEEEENHDNKILPTDEVDDIEPLTFEDLFKTN